MTQTPNIDSLFKIHYALCVAIEGHLANYVNLTSKKRYPVSQVDAVGKILLTTLKTVGDELGQVDAANYPLLAKMQQEHLKSGESWENLAHRFFLTHRWKQ